MVTAHHLTVCADRSLPLILAVEGLASTDKGVDLEARRLIKCKLGPVRVVDQISTTPRLGELLSDLMARTKATSTAKIRKPNTTTLIRMTAPAWRTDDGPL